MARQPVPRRAVDAETRRQQIRQHAIAAGGGPQDRDVIEKGP